VRTIDKRTEPPCLADLRREAARIEAETEAEPSGGDWDPGHCADTIRKALCAEQAGLCAYCMQRIKPHGYRSELHSAGGMKIEHFEERAAHPRRMYDWDNLLGVCGGEYRGASGLVEHCDTSRGDKPLQVHPATAAPPRPEDVFEFRGEPPASWTGAKKQGVWIHALDQSVEGDIDMLNLNADHLVDNRLGVKRELQERLRNLPDERARRLFLRSRLKTASEAGPRGLPPFAPLVVDYVERKMRAKGTSP